ncbi:hypothetical protein [Aestuariibacter salexigens]|uniref:hypothetical protein n=1 Tax=Aestuariibacter salexigens TaxID=226010 RepID=UPI000420564D|nr:hypothetical protein [Aestuariibacter salexigens]
MQGLAKNLLAGAVFAALMGAGAVLADDDIQRKVIEIRSMKDQDVKVMVEHDGIEEVLTLTQDEVADPVLLESRLSGLDEETRETLMQALSGTRHMLSGDLQFNGHNAKKVMVINKGDGESVNTMVHGDVDMEFEFVNGDHQIRKHIIVGDEDGVLTGHTDAIVKLIERGQFTQEELDKIQSAIDVKR